MDIFLVNSSIEIKRFSNPPKRISSYTTANFTKVVKAVILNMQPVNIRKIKIYKEIWSLFAYFFSKNNDLGLKINYNKPQKQSLSLVRPANHFEFQTPEFEVFRQCFKIFQSSDLEGLWRHHFVYFSFRSFAQPWRDSILDCPEWWKLPKGRRPDWPPRTCRMSRGTALTRAELI